MDEKQILHENQCDFKAGRSVKGAVYKLIISIQNILASGSID